MRTSLAAIYLVPSNNESQAELEARGTYICSNVFQEYMMLAAPRKLSGLPADRRGGLLGLIPVVVALLAPALGLGSQPFAVALPNGYYIERNRAAGMEIVKRNGSTVLAGPIVAYAVYKQFVAGAVGTWPPRAFSYPNELPFPGSPDARYFILDTQSGRLDSDLSKDAWGQRLEALGIPIPFRITAPILP